MKKYINATGLAYLWSKLKEKLATIESFDDKEGEYFED